MVIAGNESDYWCKRIRSPGDGLYIQTNQQYHQQSHQLLLRVFLPSSHLNGLTPSFPTITFSASSTTGENINWRCEFNCKHHQVKLREPSAGQPLALLLPVMAHEHRWSCPPPPPNMKPFYGVYTYNLVFLILVTM